MNKDWRNTSVARAVFLAILGVSFLGPAVRVSKAADCKALAEAITKEKTLMTRKSMIDDAMKACPKDAEIVYQQGYTFERLRKYDDALRSYKRAIALDSGNSRAHFSIGDIQMIMKNYQDAAAAYENGLQHDPGDARAKGSLQEARKMYQDETGKAIEKTPEVKPEPKHEAKPEVKPEPKVEAAKSEEGPPPVVAFIQRLQVPFASADAVLSQDSQDALSVVVGQAMRRKDMQAIRFEVGGYSDNVEDPAKSQEIARRRAEVVQKFLIDNFGIAADRLPVASYGQSRPRVPNNSQANQELNRRVEFTKIN